MKTIWNNRQESRDRQACACLVTVDGNFYWFTGQSIVGVCNAIETAREKNGKWSNSTYTITHADTTAFVSWYQDWDTGRTWPQSSWDAAFIWLAEKAPTLDRQAFVRFVRSESRWSKTVLEWDAAAMAEVEFSAPPTAEQLATIESKRAEVAVLKVAADAARDAAKEMAQLREKAEQYAREKAASEAQAVEDKRKASIIGGAQWGALEGLKL